MEDGEESKHYVETFCKNLCIEYWGVWLRIDGLPIPRILDQQAAWLEHPFDET